MISEKRGSYLASMLSAGGISFTCNVFRPAEAAEMTGLSALMQRDWRDRGYLPHSEGHARYDVFDIARMFIMRVLSESGIGPKWSKNFSQKASNAMVFHLLNVADAYENSEQFLKNQSDIEDIRSALVDEEYRFAYMICWADGEVEFCNDIGEAFAREHPTLKGYKHSRQYKPVLVFNLKEMITIGSIAPRPFIRLLSTKGEAN